MLVFLVFVLAIASLAAGLGIFQMASFLKTPASAQGQDKIFTISPGQSLARISRNLQAQELISDHTLFTLYARYKKAATRLKAGEYQISSSSTPVQVLDRLLKGRVMLYRLTVPEGLNMDETALLVQKAGFCGPEQFLPLCQDSEFIQKLSVESHSLEGYLYPTTYYFPKEANCRQIIQKMVDTFHNIYTKEWKNRTEELGFTVNQVVTLASIIEKETGNASERPLISSVFHNRLEKKMRLQSDPTVIYGDKEFDGRIRRRHLDRITPYNTYQISGLPKGPIANPGALALEATLYPVESSYLYFVSKNDTTHKFSKNLSEHNRAVRKYQLNR